MVCSFLGGHLLGSQLIMMITKLVALILIDILLDGVSFLVILSFLENVRNKIVFLSPLLALNTVICQLSILRLCG